MSWMDRPGALADLALPAGLVDLDAFDSNVARIAGDVAPSGKRLRLASKSIRVPALIERVLAHGDPYRGVMCYSARELLFLARRGIDDLLLAYPCLQRADLDALAEAHASGATVTAVVDSLAHLHALASCGSAQRPIRAALEVDASLRAVRDRVHLGVRRSAIRTAEEAVSLFRRARSIAGVRLSGLMVYEAQVAGLPDRNPHRRATNPMARWVRRVSARRVAERRQDIADALAAAGFELELYNGGGTGSLSWARAEPVLTEVTAGSAFFCPHLFDYYSNLDLQPALFFALAVTRVPGPGYVTCQGGGYVSSGQPGWDKVPVPHWPRGLELLGAEACGEVQTPLRVPRALALAPGHPVIFRPAKAGELAEHFTRYHLVEGGQVRGCTETYRGLGAAFG